MEKKPETFRAKVWWSAAKDTFGTVRAWLYTLIFTIVVTVAKLVVFGLDSAMSYAQEFFITFVVAGGLFSICMFFANLIFRAPYLVGEYLVKENEKLGKLLESKELPLLVEPRGSTAQNNEQGNLVLTLIVDVINIGRREIKLDAHFSSIYQWTDQLPKDRVNDISTSYMGRLQWDDGSYEIVLKPGFPELKRIKISTLDCASQEFVFIHEKPSKAPPRNEDARYRIVLGFKGKLEDDPDYQSFGRTIEFLVSPANCILDFRPEVDNFQGLPDNLRNLLPPISRS